MKFYVICAVLFCAPAVLGLFSSSIDDVFHSYEATCASSSGATDASIELARKNRQIPQTPQLNAFSQCMLQKYNVMDNNGFINPDVRTYSVVTDVPDNTWAVSEKCKILRGTDAGDTARRIMNCYLDNNQLVLGLTPRV